MKKIFIGIVLLMITYSCSNSNASAEIKLESMVCGSCSSKIKQEISQLDGVVKIEIDDNKKLGVVKYKTAIIDLKSIENAISELGYSANKTEANPVAYEALASCCKIGTLVN
ncbi:MAG: hypothetical protein CMG75_06135 [Candidatus Marinimicrobia bacterium]|nr:hypothetical protein [Candidatus Neomarinimicrobiota bacterium]|tara:strand:- start:244 stop:579 length:336 start_codon:yes stop_codon:yes gene_type:complete